MNNITIEYYIKLYISKFLSILYNLYLLQKVELAMKITYDLD